LNFRDNWSKLKSVHKKAWRWGVMAKRNSIEFPKNISLSHLTKGWRNKKRFLFDLASTDHKIYYSDRGGNEINPMFEGIIVIAHQLPGYFMCIGSDLVGPIPFMDVKKSEEDTVVKGLKPIATYLAKVSKYSMKHNLTAEDVFRVSKMIDLYPGTSPFEIEME
jgi:hypothetical protein